MTAQTGRIPATGPAAAGTSGTAVSVVDVSRTYRSSGGDVHALAGITFDVPRGQLVALVGRSGSGKTTLLNCIGGLDRPTSGRVRIGEHEVTALDETGRTRLRRDELAFVFQTFGLVPLLSAAENVGLPMRLRRVAPAEREARVAHLLELVGLAPHAAQRPSELSGGQQQRVAIARALANSPRLLVADEPTGQLDAETGAAIMALLRAVVRAEGMTAIISTHDATLMAMADRTIRLADGRLVEDTQG
ncbi:ABC transporter ATP-binding protein [Actinotalea fermentans]|uniref:ABC transporter ATP-binding protein n=1 Tax=Actinotalea fermentans TaxID=43671 RepID=A0A511YZ55_9CELL|nr:ABC transporter ATP-binding protein [Actinotalea fermentans]KGM15171.1 ABC transporter [Actinotalea fermentans ATCC 43279 = JCM 9966 = DSM 3133]GEN80472.1 ABC transporter ATP-binding protein [Actinotalea fermentans]